MAVCVSVPAAAAASSSSNVRRRAVRIATPAQCIAIMQQEDRGLFTQTNYVAVTQRMAFHSFALIKQPAYFALCGCDGSESDEIMPHTLHICTYANKELGRMCCDVCI